MVLDPNGGGGREIAFIVGNVFVFGGSHDPSVVLGADAVHEGGDVSGLHHLGAFEFGCGENDVVSLPFSGLFDGIDQWWSLAIDASGHAVGVGWVVVTVEHLAFITIHEKHARIALFLGVALGVGLALPLDVELAAGVFRLGEAVTSCDVKLAIFELPGARNGLSCLFVLAD